MEKVKTEIARVVIEVCRSLPQLEPAAKEAFLGQPDLIEPVIALVTKTDDAILQAQGYLAMVLLARERAGLLLVNEAMRTEEVFDNLAQAVNGEKTSKLNPDALLERYGTGSRFDGLSLASNT